MLKIQSSQPVRVQNVLGKKERSNWMCIEGLVRRAKANFGVLAYLEIAKAYGKSVLYSMYHYCTIVGWASFVCVSGRALFLSSSVTIILIAADQKTQIKFFTTKYMHAHHFNDTRHNARSAARSLVHEAIWVNGILCASPVHLDDSRFNK